MCVWYLSGTVQRQGVYVEVSLDGIHGVELHIEQEEYKSVQSWTQPITQASDACYHPLDHTCRSWYWVRYWEYGITADIVTFLPADIFRWQFIDFTDCFMEICSSLYPTVWFFKLIDFFKHMLLHIQIGTFIT